jgi:hypothetical protein
MDSKNARHNSNAANPADELDITLSADGSLIKKPIGNAKRNIEKSSGGSPDSNGRLLYQQQQHKQRRMDLQDKMNFGPVHRCCQIFNVLVNLHIVIFNGF